MKRKIYKTNIYIPSEDYINKNINATNELIHRTELEVCVVPNHNFTYATDIITGIKIPIGNKIFKYQDEDLTDIITSYYDKKGEILGYFVRGRENKINLGILSINKQFLEEANGATEEDIINYRKDHPNKEEYKQTQQFIFEGFNDRIQTVKKQKQMQNKK